MQIVSSRLAVEISEPGTLYRGARFDWTGFVTQVTLDQQHTFCAPEALAGGRGTGGVGLCNEFGIRQPLAYDEVAAGAQFPKLGVGLLTRPDQRVYMFMRPYAVDPFPISVALEPHAASFVVEPVECAGYAARLHKRLSVVDATLMIDYRLENVGSRPIITTEYTHNFLCIDQHWPGPAYRLRLDEAVLPPSLPAPLMIADGSIGWQSSPDHSYEWTLHAPQPAPHSWELVHTTSGVGLRETDSFGWQTLNLWGAAHVLSPESFLALQVAPGATAQWSRSYQFFGRRG